MLLGLGCGDLWRVLYRCAREDAAVEGGEAVDVEGDAERGGRVVVDHRRLVVIKEMGQGEKRMGAS